MCYWGFDVFCCVILPPTDSFGAKAVLCLLLFNAFTLFLGSLACGSFFSFLFAPYFFLGFLLFLFCLYDTRSGNLVQGAGRFLL